MAVFPFNVDRDDAYSLLQFESVYPLGALSQAIHRQNKRRSNGRMAGTRQIDGGCENAYAVVYGRVCWLRNASRFGEVKLSGDRLHYLRRNTVDIGENG